MNEINRGTGRRFLPGQSGNPSGRPKSQFGEYVRNTTKDGKELVDKVLEIMRNSKDDRIILYAAEWLARRGWGNPERLQIIYNGSGRRDGIQDEPVYDVTK